MSNDTLKRDYSEEELVQLAKERIKAKRDLYSHIAAYIFVNIFLVFLYLLTNNFKFDEYPWFIWPLAGWGLGLAFHIFETIQQLNFKHNASVLEKEISKIKKHLKD